MQTHTHTCTVCVFVCAQAVEGLSARCLAHRRSRTHTTTNIIILKCARGTRTPTRAAHTHARAHAHTERRIPVCARAHTRVRCSLARLLSLAIIAPGGSRISFFFVGLRYCFQANLSFGGIRKCTRFTIHRTNRTKPTYSLLHLCPIRANRFATFFLYFPNVFVCH